MEFSLLETVFISLFLLCFVVQLFFTLFVHTKLFFSSSTLSQLSSAKPISVIVYARNQKANLEQYLPIVLAQSYPKFEVVVVDDRSWDGTKDFLENLSSQYEKLKIVSVNHDDKFVAGKKFAITMGVKAAKNDWLVFTDANCMPTSEDWLSMMQAPQEDKVEILIGHSFQQRKKGLFGLLFCYEFFLETINNISFALKGFSYVASGQNLAYSKKLFFDNRGFSAHMHLISGEDKLFVNSNAHKNNTKVVLSPQSYVLYNQKVTYIQYLKQKKQDLKIQPNLKFNYKLLSKIQKITKAIFYVLLGVLLSFQSTTLIASGVFILDLLVRSFVYPRLFQKLEYGWLKWWFPLLDIFWFLFFVFNSFTSLFIKKSK